MQYPVNYISIPGEGYTNKHKAIDFGWYSVLHHNQPIYSVEDGEVIYVKYQSTGGNVIHIRHKVNGEYYVSEYGHLKDYCVVVGQQVSRGQKIGCMGATGQVSGEHLHGALCKGSKITYTSADKWVNPMGYYEVYPDQTVKKDTAERFGNKIKYYTDDIGIYRTLYNMNIRKTPNGARVKVKECTDAMKKALTSKKPNDYAVIKKGTNFTVLGIEQKNNAKWGKNYSGYVCLEDSSTKYCKKV
jgi:murein DD-endopeptidase MepM/ murein hydrolase activator NlpD